MAAFIICSALFIYTVTAKFNACPILEDTKCSNLMTDRFDLSVEEYSNLSPLHQWIMQDNINCLEEDRCPIMLDPIIGQENKCDDNGLATDLKYPCKNIDLLSFIPLRDLGSHVNASGNDIWGWTHYDDNNNYIGYYALTGQYDGTSIVDITDPLNPNVLAFVQSNVDPKRFVIWRDIKTFGDFAFVVADAKPQNDHHLQAFNISNIINRAKEYQLEFGLDMVYNISGNDNDEDIVIYTQFGSSHNIHINEDSGYLYAVGIADCNGGVHIVDINNPLQAEYAGCYDGANYTHDIQCVNYHGPDIEYNGNEICFAFTPIQPVFPSNLSALVILDVTDKENIIELSRTPYNLSAYSHQGWVTSNHDYLLLDDEGDEQTFPDLVPTQLTYIWDIRDLTNPDLINIYESNLTVTDHNQYIIDNGKGSNDDGYKGFVFQSNYEAGLRVLNIDDIANGNIYEIAYFDNYIWIDANSTTHDTVNPRGSWSVYPYFKPQKNGNEYSDVVVVHNINTGLYVLRVNVGLNNIFDDESGKALTDMEIITIFVVAVIVITLIIILLMVYCKRKRKRDLIKKYENMVDVEQTDYGTTAQ